MTLPRGAGRALYTGNGQAVEFPFLFKVWEEEQLSVLITSPGGVTSSASGWTATLDEDGGTVRYLHEGAPLPEGWKLAIVRDMPFVQEVDLVTGTRFDPEVIETALDMAAAERQQLLERLARAVVVDPTDERGPEALMGEIRSARDTAVTSASDAAESATEAAEAAFAAAGSAAHATEQREAACRCAQVAEDAAHAAQESADIAKNKEVLPPTDTRRGGIRVGAGLHLEEGGDGEADILAADTATPEKGGIVQPDGATTTVDGDGLLSALGGNLVCNDEVWLTESGTFAAQVTGWHEALLIDGGWGGGVELCATHVYLGGGRSGARASGLVYLTRGQEVPVTIGAAGQGCPPGSTRVAPGDTSFGALTVEALGGASGDTGSEQGYPLNSMYYTLAARGGSDGGYGAGGYAVYRPGGVYEARDGRQGAIRLRFWNPAKAAGPAAAPGLLRAGRAAAAPATVNLYDPATGLGSVWREEDAGARLACGFVTEEAWLEMCARKAAEERAAWLASPVTVADRFSLLRAARDGRLAASDYLVAPDYPLTEEERATVTAYRQALRDLPAQTDAPWDGGGEETPWPEPPATGADKEAAPCA